MELQYMDIELKIYKTTVQTVKEGSLKDSCQGSFMSLNIIPLHYLYIQEAILYVKEKGRYTTSDQIHAYNTRTSSDCNTYIHNIYKY
jgi:hypothetical protein